MSTALTVVDDNHPPLPVIDRIRASQAATVVLMRQEVRETLDQLGQAMIRAEALGSLDGLHEGTRDAIKKLAADMESRLQTLDQIVGKASL